MSDGNKWIQFPRGTGRFGISSREEAATPEVRSLSVFEVQDLDATLLAVVRTGGRVVDERDMGNHGRTLTVADPAGISSSSFRLPPAKPHEGPAGALG